MELALEITTLQAIGLFLVRTSVLVLSAPLLGQLLGSSGTKVALIVILTGVSYGAVGQPLEAPVAAPLLALMAMREALIGAFLSIACQCGLLVIRVMGEMLSLDMGLQMASQVDPMTGISSSVVTRMYEGFAILGLFAVDAHHWLVQSLIDSYGRAPAGVLQADLGVAPFIVQLTSQAISAGLAFGAPFMTVMALVTVLIGLLARTVPQINVLELGFSLRVLVALGLMLVLAPLIGPLFSGLFTDIRDWTRLGLDALGG